MNVRELCEMIDMPAEVIKEIEKVRQEEYSEVIERYWKLIQDKSKWDTAMDEIEETLKDNKNGLQCLALMLHIGLKTYREYTAREIPVRIFKDTMGCFSRFVKEHKESYGTYGFDREWWTVRELSLREFRLGELEYEMIEEDGTGCISVHIPSDARLEQQRCRESFREARNFFAKYAVDYTDAEYYCESWLLSPKLEVLLSKESNIIKFQNDFFLDFYDPEDFDFMNWVFKNRDLPLTEVPQNTSLQRKMKTYLQSGGKIGVARGHLKSDIFL